MKEATFRPPGDIRGVAYFAGNQDGIGLIKVGFSENPLQRLRQLNAASPIPLAMLAMAAATADEEWLFHARYREWHARGEWFERSDLLMSDIAALNRNDFSMDCLKAERGFSKGLGSSWWLPRDQVQVIRTDSARLVEEAWLLRDMRA